MANTSVSDIEQSAISAAVARHGAMADRDLINAVLDETLQTVTPMDLLMMAQEDPDSLLLKSPAYTGTVESPAELMRQNLREYLDRVLEMKLAQLEDEQGGV